jgi:uncharacterized protein (TIGR02996 family)
MSTHRAPRPEVLAFLQDIKQNPDDNTPRLIFADWLEENGDPRGEFVRVQCELADCAPSDPRRPLLQKREKELFSRYRDVWLEPLLDDVASQSVRRADAGFHRGLLHLRCPLDLLREREWSNWQVWSTTESLAWIEGLNLSGVRAEPLRDLCATPLLSMIGLLGLELSPADYVQSVLLLANCPHLTQLAGLNLGRATLTAQDLNILSTSDVFPQLQRLELAGAAIDARGIAFLRGFPHLSHLDLKFNMFGDAGVTELAGLPLHRLRSLILDSNGITDRGAMALSYSASLKELRQLSLGGNLIGSDGAAALARSPIADNLLRLNLKHNRIGAKGADGIIYSPYLQSLIVLELEGNSIPEARRQRLRQRYKTAALL